MAPKWPRNGRQSSTKSGGHSFGSLFLAILSPLGPSWAQLGSCLQPSYQPNSPLETSMAHIGPPKLHLASFAKPSTCPKHNFVSGLQKICYSPSSQHVTPDLALQSPTSQPKNPLKHPETGPRSPKIAQDGPEMVPKTCGNH